MRRPCDLDVVVIECRLSETIRFGIINGHLSLICKAPSCMTNLSSLNILSRRQPIVLSVVSFLRIYCWPLLEQWLDSYQQVGTLPPMRVETYIPPELGWTSNKSLRCGWEPIFHLNWGESLGEIDWEAPGYTPGQPNHVCGQWAGNRSGVFNQVTFGCPGLLLTCKQKFLLSYAI